MFLLTFICLFACGERREQKITIDPDIKYSADTMFSKRKSMIRDSMDSICLAETRLLFAMTRDSLLQVELKRIRQLSQKKDVQ